jgi:hypothetical protein
MLLYEVPIEVHEAHQHLHVFRGCVGRPILTLNSHFSALQYRPYSQSVSKKTLRTWSLCCVIHIRPQVVVHISLKPRQCISQPEWHDPIFKLTLSGPESCLNLIALFDSDTVIRAAYIQSSPCGISLRSRRLAVAGNGSLPMHNGNRRITSLSHLHNDRSSTLSVRPETGL